MMSLVRGVVRLCLAVPTIAVSKRGGHGVADHSIEWMQGGVIYKLGKNIWLFLAQRIVLVTNSHRMRLRRALVWELWVCGRGVVVVTVLLGVGTGCLLLGAFGRAVGSNSKGAGAGSLGGLG